MEGAGHVEDLLAVLDGDDAPRRETAAIAGTVDLIDDRDLRVAGADEIGVERMAQPLFHGAVGRHQGLGDHLAPENALAGFLIGALAAEEIDFQTLQVEQVQQV